MVRTPDPTRVVADADVLAADLFIDGPARAAMDVVRSHSWLELFASDALLDEAETVITRLGSPALAADWRTQLQDHRHFVDHEPGDTPSIASAYAAEAGHLLTYDDRLTGATAGVTMRRAMPLSVRTPEAFVATVDVASLYAAAIGGDYPGPDADPRG